MSPSTQHISEMYERLTEHEQNLIADLIARLLPDDIATPDDLAAISKSQSEYERGEAIHMDDINWE